MARRQSLSVEARSVPPMDAGRKAAQLLGFVTLGGSPNPPRLSRCCDTPRGAERLVAASQGPGRLLMRTLFFNKQLGLSGRASRTAGEVRLAVKYPDTHRVAPTRVGSNPGISHASSGARRRQGRHGWRSPGPSITSGHAVTGARRSTKKTETDDRFRTCWTCCASASRGAASGPA